MPPATIDEQFKFLISCIRHANNGKVDFSAVAEECGIISKGAAAKRYERMMRAHGISSPAPSGRPPPTSSPSKRDDESPVKKRKVDKGKDAVFTDATDDDDGMENIKPEGTNKDSALLASAGHSSSAARKRAATAGLDGEDGPSSDPFCIGD